MSTAAVLSRLAEFAEDQWGMFTRAQAASVDVARSTLARLSNDGPITRVAFGVYRVRGGAAHPYANLYAEWLALDPVTPAWQRDETKGVVSHQSAAECYELGDFSAPYAEFTMQVRRHTTRRDVRIYQRRDLGVEGIDWEWIHDLPTTRPLRIVSDLMHQSQDPSQISTVASDAIRRGIFSKTDLVSVADSWGTAYGRAVASGDEVINWLLSEAEASGELDT